MDTNATPVIHHRNLPLLLLQSREAVLARFRPLLNQQGVTEQQWRVIRALDQVGPMEPRQIGSMCCISSPSMAGILARMDDMGLISRQRMEQDQRRVLVAQALVHKPQVIVLDEPTAGVDVELRQTLWQFIAKLNKQGSTVLLTTHYLEEAEALCGRIAMLKQGRMVALAQTSELLKSASSNVLRFKIDSELPKALADKARITGRIVQLPAHNAHEIEQYLSAIREAGLVAEDVEIRKADLEDVFLEVMAEKIGVAT